MSMVDTNGEKVALSPIGKQLWETLEREWARGDRRKWRRLAIIHLHVYCGWRFDMIARAFGITKGHAVRGFHRTVLELREHFTYSAPFFDGDGGEVSSSPDRSSFLAAAQSFLAADVTPERDKAGKFIRKPERAAA